MAPGIVLWYSPGACSLAVHIALLEAGLDFSTADIDAVNGIPESFSRNNSKLKVPVMILNGHNITETPAIITAISQLKLEQNLLGATNLEVVRAYEWMNWLLGNLHGQGCGMLFRPGRFTDDEGQFEAVRNKGRATTSETTSISNQHSVGSMPSVTNSQLLTRTFTCCADG